MRYSNHNILVKDPHPQSYAALVMLTKKLAPKKTGFRVWLKYRAWYLREHLRKHKSLTCYYCGKTSLKKESDTAELLATLDHVYPVSKGGPRFLSSNIVVACFRCNGRKSDKSVEEFLASQN